MISSCSTPYMLRLGHAAMAPRAEVSVYLGQFIFRKQIYCRQERQYETTLSSY